MSITATPGLRAVLARELRYLRGEPWDLSLLLWFPAASLALLLWMFSAGIPTGLPIAIVDEDHSAASRELVRRMDATRGLAISLQATSLEAAQPAVRSGAVYGVVHIPAHWERDRLRNTPQPVVLYGNAQFSLVAGVIGGDVRAAVSSMAMDRAVASEARFGGGFEQAALRLGGVQADLRTLFNPSLSYEAYFAGMLMPVVLHLFCVIAAVSALGREFRNRTVDAWLQAAGGSLTRALLGKLAPLAAIYLLLALAVVVTFAGWRGWPAAGSLLLWMVAISVLMLVSITVALLLVALTVNLRTALSLTGVYVATGLAFSGFSYPRAAMGEAAQWWSGLLPYTHYLPVQQGQWLGAAPASAWAQGMAPLLLFIVVPLLAGLPLLSRAVQQPARWGGR
jgi:ABC-2 type transport system permease protein